MIYFKDWIHLSLGCESHHEDVVLGLVHKEIMRYIREEKHFNLQSVKLTFFFFFSSTKHLFRYFSRRARYEICLKLTIDTRIHRVNDKVKNKDTVHVVLVFLLLTLNTFHFLLQCFYC